MKLALVFAHTLALSGTMPAHADDEDPGRTSGAADRQAENEFRWAAADRNESTLLPQAEAVYRTLRRHFGPRPSNGIAIETVSVDAAVEAAQAGPEDCQFLEIPGSRIRQDRCYFPSQGESALNDYQFEQELRDMRRQQDMAAAQRAIEAAVQEQQAEQARQNQQFFGR